MEEKEGGEFAREQLWLPVTVLALKSNKRNTISFKKIKNID